MVTGDASDFYALADRLDLVPVKLRSRVGKDVDAWGRGTERDARALAPERTGELRDGIRAQARGLSVDVTSEAPYSLYVEEGTSDTAPQPFMGPAVERNTPEFDKSFGAALEDLL